MKKFLNKKKDESHKTMKADMLPQTHIHTKISAGCIFDSLMVSITRQRTQDNDRELVMRTLETLRHGPMPTRDVPHPPLPISFVAAVFYQDIFNSGAGVKTVAAAMRKLTADIAEMRDLEKSLCGYGEMQQYRKDKTRYLNERQVNVLCRKECDITAERVYLLWTVVTKWTKKIQEITL